MSPATCMFLAALLLSVSHSISLEREGTSSEGNATPANCFNCTVCENPCAPPPPEHPLPPPTPICPPPPPTVVYPSPPPPVVYPSPPAPISPQEKCQMSTCVLCCLYPQQYPPPRSNYYPYNKNSASSPCISSLLLAALGALLWFFLQIVY